MEMTPEQIAEIAERIGDITNTGRVDRGMDFAFGHYGPLLERLAADDEPQSLESE